MALTGIPPYERRCTYFAFPHNGCFHEASDDGCSLLHSVCGINTGYRHHNFFTESTGVMSWEVTYDFFSDPIAPNFLYISRVDLEEAFLTGLLTIRFRGSNDDVNYVDIQNFTAPFNLSGSQENDFFECFDPGVEYRYIRIRFNFSAQTRVSFSKIYFGELFDMEQEPSVSLVETREQTERGVFQSTSNIKIYRRNGRPVYTYRFEYKGLSDNKAKQFLDKMIILNNRFTVLADLDNRELFNKHGVINGVISGVEVENTAKDFNNLSFNFVEML